MFKALPLILTLAVFGVAAEPPTTAAEAIQQGKTLAADTTGWMAPGFPSHPRFILKTVTGAAEVPPAAIASLKSAFTDGASQLGEQTGPKVLLTIKASKWTPRHGFQAFAGFGARVKETLEVDATAADGSLLAAMEMTVQVADEEGGMNGNDAALAADHAWVSFRSALKL